MTTEAEDKTEFKFSELSDSAKESARDEYRGDDYPGYDWWDDVYEDAVRMGALIGIEISKTWHASNNPNRKGYDTIDIMFSGFSSQGDGACFEGNYKFMPDAVAKIIAETSDEALICIAQELAVLQLTRRLLGLEPFSASIKTSGRYSHSNTLDVTLSGWEDDTGDDVSALIDEEAAVTALMRNFADWIYKQLEAQYDYLTSDEYVDERLNEDDALYDEDGATIWHLT